ncbi:Acetylornithine aminotransferase (ACOAT) [Durusdinium trenchii]|uniref:Acetylornithine aminotransferase (ACOAT) n=1 Tax=Durusdinium trenchii TaxID=1381693 RepID=A0ABP0R7U5_9DINO
MASLPIESSSKAMKRLAARSTVASDEGPGIVVERRGAKLRRVYRGEIEETFLLGAACSEVFTGPRLAKVLRPALEHQRLAIEKMERGESWEPLSIHTSAGFPGALTGFVECLEKNLPWTGSDWFVNVQQEGATAVWAGVEALGHLRQMAPHPKCSASRSLDVCRVGVAERSYHGTPTTALGQPAKPLWPNAPRTTGQVSYPLPPLSGEKECEEYLRKFDAFLAEHPDIGIFVFEPQWGSSRLARAWPPQLLKEVIARCQRSGAYVLCDEVMCGLGRHGEGTLFLSQAWALEPDAVTFGKSLASGTFPLSGVIVRHGSKAMWEAGIKIQQSHTYAGSSALAYLTATEILRELPGWFDRANRSGQMVRDLLGPVADGKFFRLYGQGLLWGGEFAKTVAATDLKAACHKEGVWPYIVESPSLGLMISPPMDIDEDQLREGLEGLVRVVNRLKAGLPEEA